MAKTFLHTNIAETSSNLFTTLYSWKSPERYWTPKGRGWFIGYSLFFVLIISAGVLLQEYIFVLAVIAFVFLWFVQATIPPEITEHKITTIGVRTYHKLYRWKNIKNFWFSMKNEVIFLNLETQNTEKDSFTKRYTLLIDEKDQDKDIFKTLIRFLDYGEPEEIGYGLLTRFTSGKYLEITRYLSKSEHSKSKHPNLEASENP